MRIGVIVFIATCMLTACVHLEIKKNINVLNRVQPGDTQATVFDRLGSPDLRNDINDRRFVAFYQTKTGNGSTSPVTAAMCTPIAFENGKVVSVGEDLTERWTQQENERVHQAEIAERQQRQTEMANAARQQAEAARREKIAALEKQVKPVPASNAALNLKLYSQLLDLDPDNTRYQKKVAVYEERLAQQEKARRERAVLAAQAKQRQAWEQARDARNKHLRQYSGNGTAEMAVHDMGNGALYVWVKNVGKQIITTHPDHFTLVDSKDNKVDCKISDSLDSVLEPGSISHGKIEYSKEIQPKELIFQNRESGRISKSFD